MENNSSAISEAVAQEQCGSAALVRSQIDPSDSRHVCTLGRLAVDEGQSLVELLQTGRQAVLAAHTDGAAAVAEPWRRRCALLQRLSFERRLHHQVQADSSKKQISRASLAQARFPTVLSGTSHKAHSTGEGTPSSTFAAWVWTREGLVSVTPPESASVSNASGSIVAAAAAQPWHLTLMEGLAKKLLLRCALLALREACKLGILQRAAASSARLGTPAARRLLRRSWHGFRGLLVARRHRVRAVLSMERCRAARAASNALALCASYAAKRCTAKQQLRVAASFWVRRRALHTLLTLQNYARAKLSGLTPLAKTSHKRKSSERQTGSASQFLGLKLQPGRALVTAPIVSATRRSRTCPKSLLPLRSFSISFRRDVGSCSDIGVTLLDSSHDALLPDFQARSDGRRPPPVRHFRSSALSAEAAAWGRRRAAACAIAALRRNAACRLRAVAAAAAANTHQRCFALRKALARLVPSCRQLRHAHVSWALAEAWQRRRPLAFTIAQWQEWMLQHQHTAAQRAKVVAWRQKRCMAVGLRRWWRGLVLRRRKDRILHALADLSNHRRLLKVVFRAHWARPVAKALRSSSQLKFGARERRLTAQDPTIRATNNWAERLLTHGLVQWRNKVLERQNRARLVHSHAIQSAHRWFSYALQTAVGRRAAAASLSPAPSVPFVAAAASRRMSEAEAVDELLADENDAQYSNTNPRSRRCPSSSAATSSASMGAERQEPRPAETAATNATTASAKFISTDDEAQIVNFVVSTIRPMLGPSLYSKKWRLSQTRESTAENIALAAFADVFAPSEQSTRTSMLPLQTRYYQDGCSNLKPDDSITLAWFGPLSAAVRARKRALKHWRQWSKRQRFHRSMTDEAQRCRLRSCFGALALFAGCQKGLRAILPSCTDAVHPANQRTSLLIEAFPHCVGVRFCSIEGGDGSGQTTCRCCLLGPALKVRDAVGIAIAAAESPTTVTDNATHVVASLQKEHFEKHRRAWLRLALRCLRKEALASSLANRVASARADSHYRLRRLRGALFMFRREAKCRQLQKEKARERVKCSQVGLSKAASQPPGLSSRQHAGMPISTPTQKVSSQRPTRILQPKSATARSTGRNSITLKRSPGVTSFSTTRTGTEAVPKYSYASLVKASPRPRHKLPALLEAPTASTASSQSVLSVMAEYSNKENRVEIDTKHGDFDILKTDTSWCSKHFELVSGRQALRKLRANVKYQQQMRGLGARLEQFVTSNDVGIDESLGSLMPGAGQSVFNERAALTHSKGPASRKRAWALRRPTVCACFSRWRQFVAGRLLLGRVFAFALERWNFAVSDGVALTNLVTDSNGDDDDSNIESVRDDVDDNDYAESNRWDPPTKWLWQPPLCRGLPLARVARRVLFAWAAVAHVARKRALEASRAAATALWARARSLAKTFDGWRAVAIEAAAARRAARNRLVQNLRNRCLSRAARLAASLALREWCKWTKGVIQARSEAAAAQAHLRAQRARKAAKALGHRGTQPRAPPTTVAPPLASRQDSALRMKNAQADRSLRAILRGDVRESKSVFTSKNKAEESSKGPQNGFGRKSSTTKRALKSKPSEHQSGISGTDSKSSDRSEVSTVEGTTKETHYVEVLEDTSTLASAPDHTQGNRAANALLVEPDQHTSFVATDSSAPNMTATETGTTPPEVITFLNTKVARIAAANISSDADANAVTDAAASEALARRAATLRAEAVMAQSALELAHRSAELDAERLRRTWRGLIKLSACLVTHRASRALKQWPGRATWARAYEHYARRGLRAAVAHWRKQPALSQARAKKLKVAKALNLQLEARRAVAAAKRAAAERRAALPVWVAPNHRTADGLLGVAKRKKAAAVPWGLGHPSNTATTRPLTTFMVSTVPRAGAVSAASNISGAILGIASIDAAIQARAIMRAWRRISRQFSGGWRLGNVLFTLFERQVGHRLSRAWSIWSVATFAAEKHCADFSSSSTFGSAAGYIPTTCQLTNTDTFVYSF